LQQGFLTEWLGSHRSRPWAYEPEGATWHRSQVLVVEDALLQHVHVGQVAAGKEVDRPGSRTTPAPHPGKITLPLHIALERKQFLLLPVDAQVHLAAGEALDPPAVSAAPACG